MKAGDVFDLSFLFGDIPRDDEVAWQQYSARAGEPRRENLDQELSEEVLRFYAGFYLKFPELFASESLRESGRLYLGPAVDSISVLRGPIEHASELIPFAYMLARKLQVTIFDPAEGYFHRPDGFSEIQMSVEDQPDFFSPNIGQISRRVHSMSAAGGPSILCLERVGGSYVQVAGGDGKYLCECREVSNDSFRHWVAGRKTKPSTKFAFQQMDITSRPIPTNASRPSK